MRIKNITTTTKVGCDMISFFFLEIIMKNATSVVICNHVKLNYN